jgi:hypothetical protein
MIYDVTFTIKGLRTMDKEFYLKALLQYIKEQIEKHLQDAPDFVVDEWERVGIEGKVVSDD